MLSQCCKTWSQARSSITAEWSDGLSAFWDTAIRGSSALRAAMMRSLMDEAAATRDFATATVLLDIAKFYDSVSFTLLIVAARGPNFPPAVVLMEVLLFMSPRILKEGS
eukprot:3126618-Pyramimonas_sp.AAC.1